MGQSEKNESDEFDVVIVGSGFGGAVTACRVAGETRRVLLLERGKRYGPGDFARTPLEMSTNVWDPSEGLFGLFQLWSFARLDAVVAAGVGGGSLIYANVITPVIEKWFDRVSSWWPLEYADFAEHYSTVRKELAVEEFPLERYRQHVPKAQVFRGAAQGHDLRYRPAPLAVAFGAEPGVPLAVGPGNYHDAVRRSCRLCGQCDVGCNDGAKNSLDFTYLTAAFHAGVTIRPLSEVKQISEIREGSRTSYRVGYVEHTPAVPSWDPIPRPEGASREYTYVRAKVVVVAAGSLGTTRLLLANRPGLPRLSDRLGTRFSGNGDAIGFLTGNASARVEASSGPVITGIAEYDDGEHQFLLEDGGQPSMLSWLGEAFSPGLYRRLVSLAAARAWERRRLDPKSNISRNVHRMLRTASVSRSTLPLLAMGLDSSAGQLRMVEGRLQLFEDQRPSREYFHAVERGMRRLAATADSRYRRALSSWMSRNLTAHPLGGVPMGTCVADGVVDSWGEAFGHPGLFVADGSVIPTPIGANPSMTIAALAERFSKRIEERTQERCP